MTTPLDWSAKQACNAYEQTWEISTKEVHYGWLSPGENALQLFSDVSDGSKILDIGCGMGENVLALHERKLESYGLDLSEHMVRKARKKLKAEGMVTKPRHLTNHIRHCDARNIAENFYERFDAALSVYSLEFFPDVQEFRKAIASIAGILENNGVFVLCVSHPTGHPNYPHISNETAAISSSAVSLLIYSIRDIVNALCDSKLVVDRIIEQKTPYPSRITYEESKNFPYHFHAGKNPFSPLFDGLNNKNPHTIVYRAKKEQ